MQISMIKFFGGAATIATFAFLSSTIAFAGGQSLRKDCKLDKYGNGPRHCQCEALHEKLLPTKVLWHLSQIGVCNAIQTGQGSQPSSGRPSDDCNDKSDRGDPE